MGAIETREAIQKGFLEELSVQEVVDCSKSAGNSGCNGGKVEAVYDWVTKNGISKASEYEYVGHV